MISNFIDRYGRLAWHLVQEIRGKETFNENLLQAAVESKALEGLGEAAPQLLLQSYILTNTVLYEDGHDFILGQTEDYFYTVHSGFTRPFDTSACFNSV